jgi:hypothetical protein
MAYDRLFIQTGMTPPRGDVVTCEKVAPSAHNRRYNGATPLITGNPYRRVYQDSDGLYIKLHGRKTRVFQVSN